MKSAFLKAWAHERFETTRQCLALFRTTKWGETPEVSDEEVQAYLDASDRAFAWWDAAKQCAAKEPECSGRFHSDLVGRAAACAR